MGSLLDLYATLSLDTSEYEREVSGVSGKTGKMTGALTKAVAAGNLISSGLSKAAGAAYGFAKGSVETGISFDTAMSQVAATMGTTTDNIQYLTDAAMEMGSTTKFTAAEAANGINILAMAGMNMEDAVRKDANGVSLLSTTLDLASAGAMSMDASASYLTGTLKGFGDGADRAAYYADLMAKGATLANTDVSGLGQALSDAAATASAYGQDAESTTLSLLRLAESNVTGSAASTALAAAMKNLYTPTDQAKTALEELGVAAYENGQALDFNDVVNSLNDALAGYSQEEANAYKQTIFGIQGLDAFNKMTAVSSERVGELEEGLSQAAGSTAEQAKTQLDNLSGSLTLMSSATDGLKLTLYNTFSDELKTAVDKGTEYINIFNEGLSEGGLGGAIQSLGTIASDAFGTIDSMISASPLGTFYGPVRDGITSVVEGFGKLVSAAQEDGTLINAAIEGIGAVVDTTVGIFSSGIELFTSGFNGIVDFLSGDLSEAAATATEGLMTWASGIGETIAEGVSSAFDAVSDFAGGIMENIGGALATAGETAAGWWNDFVDFFTGSDGDAAATEEIFTGAADAIASNVENTAQATEEAMQLVSEALSGHAIEALDEAEEKFSEVALSVQEDMTSMYESVVEAFEQTGQAMESGTEAQNRIITSGFQNMVQSTSSGMQRINTATSGGMLSVKSTVGAGMASINATAGSGLAYLQGRWSSAMASIGANVRNTLSKIDAQMSRVRNMNVRINTTTSGGESPGTKKYAKAMGSAYVLNRATIFGEQNGKLLQGGESGSEMVVGTKTLMSAISSASGSEETVRKLNETNDLLREIALKIGGNQSETRVSAQSFYSEIDKALGARYRRRAYTSV